MNAGVPHAGHHSLPGRYADLHERATFSRLDGTVEVMSSSLAQRPHVRCSGAAVDGDEARPLRPDGGDAEGSLAALDH